MSAAPQKSEPYFFVSRPLNQINRALRVCLVVLLRFKNKKNKKNTVIGCFNLIKNMEA
jgi:hypothetical protein